MTIKSEDLEPGAGLVTRALPTIHRVYANVQLAGENLISVPSEIRVVALSIGVKLA